MNLKQFFDAHRGREVRVQLINSLEVDGIVKDVGDDLVSIETTNTMMMVPYTAVLFLRDDAKVPTAAAS